ncbi:hypothetical protein EIP91_000179 [Steccherinum ochraceum]|uniref:Uncharacterized protein n=1 Tax=Steccherinum ochraceum TaxID=92696 RepID=A0A4V2MXQ9_9APHY|nr:hypothetical protein EIP91_000179 [Steccherinum ochraceum]
MTSLCFCTIDAFWEAKVQLDYVTNEWTGMVPFPTAQPPEPDSGPVVIGWYGVGDEGSGELFTDPK